MGFISNPSSDTEQFGLGSFAREFGSVTDGWMGLSGDGNGQKRSEAKRKDLME